MPPIDKPKKSALQKILDAIKGVVTKEEYEIILNDLMLQEISAEDEWINLIELDIKELVKGSFLENQSIFKTLTEFLLYPLNK